MTTKRLAGRRALALAAVLPLAACDGDGGTGPIERLPRELTVAEQQVIQASNTFGLDLFRLVHATDSLPNVFLSPLSASMALGMTQNGAAGATWQGMRSGLRLGALSQEEINQSYRSLIELLRELDSRVDFRIANSIWSRRGFPVMTAFSEAVRTNFGAEARELDFADPASLRMINDWVRTATNGKIEKGLESISPADLMFVINAIYFKGTWTNEFDASKTRLAPFRRLDGSTVQVDLMTLKARLPFARTADYEAVELPYGGGAYGMVVVLPSPNRTLGSVVAGMGESGWSALVASLDTVETTVDLPKFRTRWDGYLNRPLVAMGMDSAFSPQANFSRLTPQPVCIQFVRQKTFVEVDEKGTEAAAVTVVGIGVTSAPPSLRVDRPFLFAIRERLSGTVLFIGTIGDPTREEAPEPAKPRPPC